MHGTFSDQDSFLEVRKPEGIVCTDSFSDEKGNSMPAACYSMSPDLPREMPVTVTFEVQAGRTRLTLRHAGFPAGETNDLARAGWNESPDKLAGVLGQAVNKKMV